MRFRLLRRRLTISAPRMSVRSALPWPFRWAVLALVFGFCAAIGLWAFEFGKDIAGLDGGAKEELVRARSELMSLRAELGAAKEARDKAQSVADTSSTLATAQKAAQEGMNALNRQLEAENRGLKDDLGFFEKLMPSNGAEGVTVRGLQAEVINGRQLKWQVLLIQAQKNAPEFAGRIELSFGGTQNGKPWQGSLPGAAADIKFRQYGRSEGMLDLPAQTIVKSVSVKVLEGAVVKATHTAKVSL
jgi:hypothetical protein